SIEQTNTINEELLDIIDEMDDTVSTINALQTDLFGPSGNVTTILNDLSDLERTPDGLLPTTTTFDEASDGNYGTTPRITSQAMDGDAAEVGVLSGRLSDIYDELSGLPDYD